MRVILTALCLLATPVASLAQAATIAIFPPTATDPNTAKPVAAVVVYPAPACNQPPFTETLPLTNPTNGFWADPVNPGRDCTVNVQTQITSLTPGSGYKGAIKIGASPYGPFSSAFARAAAQAHYCDTTPATSGTATPSQARTLRVCHSELGSGGPLTISGWALYVNGSRSTITLTRGTTASTGGQREFSGALTAPAAAGAYTYELAALNGTLEGARSPAFTLTVQAPPNVPVAPTKPSVQ